MPHPLRVKKELRVKEEFAAEQLESSEPQVAPNEAPDLEAALSKAAEVAPSYLEERAATGDSPGLEPSTPTSPSTSKHLDASLDEENFILDDDVPAWTMLYEARRLALSDVLPPLEWAPVYIRSVLGKSTAADKESMGLLPFSLSGDLIAGLTVGCMLVPQSLAFALLAGLPLETGLYASFAPLVAYSLFGTIRQVQPGPTALMSLLTGQALDQMGFLDDSSRVAGAAMLALVVGCASILLSILRFGFIVDFMSHSVMNAFCAAAGVTILTSQLKHLLGIAMPRKKYWWQTAWYLASHLDEIEIYTFTVGATLLLFLIFLKNWKSAGGLDRRKGSFLWRWFPADKSSRAFKILKFVADLSSVISVTIGWLWCFAFRQSGINTLRLVGSVESSGFLLMMPFDGVGEDFKMDSLIVSALVMTVVGFLETVAVGGKFAAQARYEYSPNQELLALGMSNVAGAVMAGYPTTGSFSRTAVNVMFGGTSLLSCFVSAFVVMAAVYLLLPVIALLPLCALAPLIIQGAIGVINLHEFQVALRSSPTEFFVMISTFGVSLALTVKEGLAVGFVLSVLKTMNELANPNLAVCGQLADNSFRDIRNYPKAKQFKNAIVVRIDARLCFTNARKLKDFTLRATRLQEQKGFAIEFAVIDAKAINHVDLSGCEMLEVLAETLQAHGQQLVIANLKGPVSKCLSQAGVPAALRKRGGHLCTSMEAARAIIEGKTQADQESSDIKELVRRVDTAHRLMLATSPKVLCQNALESGLGRQLSGGTRS